MSGHFVAAPWRSSGKTTLAAGLARAARHRKISVQTFKKGPDYIDPQWLASASGRACYNLDPHLQTAEELLLTYKHNLPGDSMALVEGAQGLHDGMREDCSDSNASIAKQLNLPVLLTFDGRGMNRTLAALVNGLQSFDPNVVYSGIIINRVRSARHFQKIDEAITQYTDLKLIGSLPESVDIALAEKNLGLLPVQECVHSQQIIDSTANLLEAECDLDALFTDMKTAKHITAESVPEFNSTAADALAETAGASTGKNARQLVRIGLAYDEAFHFYYQDDLNVLRSRGVEIVNASPLHDQFPDALDGLVIGGGFPERYARKLSENVDFRHGFRNAVEQGLAVHAECAGLMYLCRSIRHNDDEFAMAGCIDADVELLDRPVGRGYMRLFACDSKKPHHLPVPELPEPSCLLAHEFHHSKVTFDTNPEFIYHVERGYGIDGSHDGVRINNVHATYAHFRHTTNTPWVDWLLHRVASELTRKDNCKHV